MSKRPQSTAVIATSIATGEQTIFKSMAEAAQLGGFTYYMVQRCVRGTARQHAGFTFSAAGQLREGTGKMTRLQEVAVYRGMGWDLARISKMLGIKHDTAQKYAKQAAYAGMCPHLVEPR